MSKYKIWLEGSTKGKSDMDTSKCFNKSLCAKRTKKVNLGDTDHIILNDKIAGSREQRKDGDHMLW